MSIGHRHTAVRRGRVLAGTAALLCVGAFQSSAVAAGAGGNRSEGRTTSTPSASVDWDTAAFDLQRTGDNPDERVLTTAAVRAGLVQKWATSLGTYLDSPPVVAADVTVGSETETLVFVGSEHGLFEALNASSGAVVWSAQLGWQYGNPPACGQSPFGITDSPVIDRSTGRVYVVDGLDELYAFDLATGAVAPGYPVALSSEVAYEHVWSGLTLLDGTLYVAVASNCDIGPYYGRVVAVDTSTAQVTATFYADGPTGPYGGGIWGWGGASVSPAGDQLFVGTGNTLGSNTNAGYGDAVVKLDLPSLSVSAFDQPGIPQGDNDFGGSPVLFQAPGCPADFAIENKIGSLYLYEQGDVHLGPVQVLAMAKPSPTDFIGDPAWSPSTDLLYVGDPTTANGFEHGLVALSMNASCQLQLAWQRELGTGNTVVSPPTVARDVVYYADGTGDKLFALDAKTGRVLWRQTLGGPVFAPPVVVDGRVYVVSWDGDIYAFGT